jgi:hypothetical protein
MHVFMELQFVLKNGIAAQDQPLLSFEQFRK